MAQQTKLGKGGHGQENIDEKGRYTGGSAAPSTSEKQKAFDLMGIKESDAVSDEHSVENLTDETLEQLFEKHGGDEDAVLDEIRSSGKDYGMSNGDLQGVIEAFSETRGSRNKTDSADKLPKEIQGWIERNKDGLRVEIEAPKGDDTVWFKTTDKESGDVTQYSYNPRTGVTHHETRFANQEKQKAFDLMDIGSNSQKKKQLEVIKKTNPMQDEYHVGIRGEEDIKTFDETIDDDDSFVWGDFTKEDAKKALKSGKITIYSSRPIKQGSFVSTSKNQAEEYAGGRGKKVYSQVVPLKKVAWISGDEGQFADVD